MSESTVAVQAAFLDELMAREEEATIFLMMGTRLTGSIIGYDKHIICVADSEGNRQMVFKHAVSSIVQGVKQPQQKPAPKPKPTKNTLSLSKNK